MCIRENLIQGFPWGESHLKKTSRQLLSGDRIRIPQEASHTKGKASLVKTKKGPNTKWEKQCKAGGGKTVGDDRHIIIDGIPLAYLHKMKKEGNNQKKKGRATVKRAGKSKAFLIQEKRVHIYHKRKKSEKTP